MTEKNRPWWKEAVFYQIYPRSFYDSNGDGIGDLRGITEKLDYLKWVGVDAVWLSPVFCSPMEDNGYDISDYRKIDPVFGDNEDMYELLRQAKARGIRMILDLVVNHCSSEHPWFQKALADPDSKEAGYFIFKKTADGNPPNNWRSNFGGSVWEKLPDGRYYMHTFARKQPDLNWENPELRSEVYSMMKWWLDQGIDGFRVDAITFIKKDPTYASRETADGGLYPIEKLENFDGIGEYLSEMKREVLEPCGCMTVAEAPGVSESDLKKYEGEDGYFSMIFDFTWDQFPDGADKNDPETFRSWKSAMERGQLLAQEAGWCPIFLENHDQPRCPNKFFDRENICTESKTLLACLYFFLRGTPFIYQGQEIGMVNYPIRELSDVYDPAAHSRYREAMENGESREEFFRYLNEKGRDHARTPFQWNCERNAGFTAGTPWMPVHADFRVCCAAAEEVQEDSVLSFYRRMIGVRKSAAYRELFVDGAIEFIAGLPDKVVGYRRTLGGRTVSVLCNCSAETVEVPAFTVAGRTELSGHIILSNLNMPEERFDGVLKPFQAIVFE